MADLFEIPSSCTDEQLKVVLTAIASNPMLTDNQKAYYTEKLQNSYAKLIVSKAIERACKPGEGPKTPIAMHLDDDEIILREKRRREE